MFYFLMPGLMTYNVILIAAAVIPAVFLMGKVYRSDRLEKESPMMLRSLALAGISISVSVKSAANGRLSRSALILKDTTPAVDHEDTEALLGREGQTLTVLKPVGVADFDGVRLNVVSEGTYLSKDVRVKVTKVEGTKIIVREIPG